jgi:hypothetical protein
MQSCDFTHDAPDSALDPMPIGVSPAYEQAVVGFFAHRPARR